ncbi:hypothetical protein SLS59_000126 [Nothophoma quercina]|uniref:BTB domain-containing protein n=1 Tax=Nothophoma quercina TaxID=749835 RepID=A0ABR3S442_9PLEO
MANLLANVSFEEVTQSDLFTFHVGDKSFIAHSKAVAATSSVFERLVNGGMSESESRSAELKDVDPETFVRFLEYAYRRDYTIPLWTQDHDAADGDGLSTQRNTLQELEPMPSDEGFNVQPIVVPSTTNRGWANCNAAPSAFGAMPSDSTSSLVFRNGKKHAKSQAGSRAAFNKREYIHPTDNASKLLRVGFEPVPNTSPTQNFTSVFLAHACLYTLANMRMIQELRDLALHKLHKTLVSFELYPERLGDVAELARYAYEHGEDRSEDGRIDALRDMVVNYVACEMKVLGKHAEFRHLMDMGGEFAGDFWDIVSQE